jgi:sorting nexin-1/2
VNTSTNRSGFSYGQFSVLRRYSDFCWFHDQLCFTFPGIIMPPLPEKQAVGRFSTEFIESRRRGLEKFMSRIVAHPSLVNSEILVSFLESDDIGLAAVKDKGKAEKDKKSGSVLSWFETKVNSLTVQPNQAALEKTAADLKIDEIAEYINRLEAQMITLSKHAGSLLKRHREVAAALRDLGQAYTYFGQAEGDALGTSLIQVAVLLICCWIVS